MALLMVRRILRIVKQALYSTTFQKKKKKKKKKKEKREKQIFLIYRTSRSRRHETAVAAGISRDQVLHGTWYSSHCCRATLPAHPTTYISPPTSNGSPACELSVKQTRS